MRNVLLTKLRRVRVLKEYQKKVLIELKAASELAVYLMHTIKEEQKAGTVVAVTVCGRRVAGACVTRGERMACLHPLPLKKCLKSGVNKKQHKF